MKICSTRSLAHWRLTAPLQLNYAYNILNVMAYPLVKISILLLYLRIFPSLRFRQITWIGIGVHACIFVSHTLVTVFPCQPIRGFWTPTIPSKCIDANRFYWAQATLNVITDVFILLLPIPTIWKLRASIKQRVGLTLLFMLGGLSVSRDHSKIVKPALTTDRCGIV